jgi:hypothetical protein
MLIKAFDSVQLQIQPPIVGNPLGQFFRRLGDFADHLPAVVFSQRPERHGQKFCSGGMRQAVEYAGARI